MGIRGIRRMKFPSDGKFRILVLKSDDLLESDGRSAVTLKEVSNSWTVFRRQSCS
jgi:hypothetical protein